MTSTLHDDRIPQVLERVDLAALVAEYAGPPTRIQGRSATFRCPHRSHADEHPSFGVSESADRAPVWRCWSQCGAGGDAIDLLVWLKGSSKREAIDELAERVGLTRDKSRPRSEGCERVLTRFLEKRQWERGVVDRVGAQVVVDNYGRPRLRFPFRLAGEVVYWQDRALQGQHLKWLSPSGPIACPYEADRMGRALEVGAVVIAEGIADVVALLHGFDNPAVIGLPGSGVLKRQWAPAFSGMSVYTFGDNDGGGVAMRRRVDELIGPLAASVHHLRVPEMHNDLDEWRRADPGGFPHAVLELLDEYDHAVAGS